MRRLGKFVAATALLAVTAGCGDLGAAVGGDGKPVVVASFYPLAYVAERIAGEHAVVENLTSPGVEPHDLELSVLRTAQVAEADVAVYEQGLQPAVDEAIEQNGPQHIVDVTDVVDLHSADADHDAAEHAAAEQEGGEHEHGDVDPHFWLDPALLSKVAAAVERQLSAVDPEHAADYTANLDDLRRDLADLDADLRSGLAHCALDTVVVSHDAFGYLSKYGLDFVSINGLSPEAEPSPAHIAQLHELIEEHGITTVFSETLSSKQLSQSLAGDLGIHTAVLDPIEGLGDSTADEDYLSLMRHNLAALQEANQCR